MLCTYCRRSEHDLCDPVRQWCECECGLDQKVEMDIEKTVRDMVDFATEFSGALGALRDAVENNVECHLTPTQAKAVKTALQAFAAREKR